MAAPSANSLTGVLERIIFFNEENHYTIAELRPETAKSAEDRVTIVGPLPGVQCGETLQLTGEWTKHAQHGAQFKVVNFKSELPSSVYGIRKYLGSGLVPGIGKVYANKIVDAFGTDTFRVLSEESGKLRQVPGIGKVRAAAIKAAWDGQKTLREVHIYLQTYGVTTSQCVKIVNKFGVAAPRVIRDEPYRIAREIDGIGFKTADRLAINLGFANDAAPRLDAGLIYALETLQEDGHTAYPREELVTYTATLLETSAERIESRIDALVAEKTLVAHAPPGSVPAVGRVVPDEPKRENAKRLTEDGSPYPRASRPAEIENRKSKIQNSVIQLPVNSRAEQKVADTVRRLGAAPSGLPPIKVDAAVAWAQEKAGFEFHGLQSAAIKNALTHKFTILTGGPGTGKAQPLHARVLTPTGFRPIGSIQAGDAVISAEGSVVRVRSVHPQGLKPVFRVTFADGRACECCADHLWKIWTRTSVWSPTKRKKIRARGWRVVPLSYVQQRLNAAAVESDRMAVPLPTPWHGGSDLPVPVHPYVLGALIGDGCLKTAVLLTTTDAELLERVATLVAPLGVRLNPVTLRGKPTISHRLIARGKGHPNPIRDALVRWGLNVNSEAKFVPPEFFNASLTQRLELLRGLLDADGTVDRLGVVSFTSCSFQFAKDVQRLAWSVGAIATLGAIKRTHFTHRGERRSGRDAYTVFLQHPEPATLFNLSRKKSRTVRPRARKRLSHRLRIASIAPLGSEECVCISIDSPSGLYLTDDYIVTHNTTILRALVDILKAKKVRVTLAAPTGRAAQRLAETTGGFASTIHRLLKFENGAFTVNESHPLATDFLIVDEASMLDVRLAAALLQAVPNRAHLLLVGDVDQLPSVGAGNVLKDLIAVSGQLSPISPVGRGVPAEPKSAAKRLTEDGSPYPPSGIPQSAFRNPQSPALPVTRLSFVYRQGKESAIVTTAHAINEGHAQPPPVLGEVAQAQAWSDLNFIAASDAEDCLAKVIELCTRFIPSHFKWFNPIADVQILAPMHKGTVGVANLNTRLQAALRPWKVGAAVPSGAKPSARDAAPRPHAETPAHGIRTVNGTFEVGDKLIQLRNNYDKGLFNGDIGTVVSTDLTRGTLIADFDGERHVFERGEMHEVALAYAISIHKSQGSEYPVVIVPLLKAHFMMLQRNLVYTAITRGKKKVFVVGEPAAYSMAVRNAESKTRCTHLREKILTP